MFTDITYQDYLAASDKEALILEAIRRYKASPAFHHALEANCYFRGENSAVSHKTILRAKKISAVDAQGRRRTRNERTQAADDEYPFFHGVLLERKFLAGG